MQTVKQSNFNLQARIHISKTDIFEYICSYVLRSDAGHIVNRPQVGIGNSIYCGGITCSYVGNSFHNVIAFEI